MSIFTMKHNIAFVNGYPDVCPNEGSAPLSVGDKPDIGIHWKLEIQYYGGGRTQRRGVVVGSKCIHCGAIDYFERRTK